MREVVAPTAEPLTIEEVRIHLRQMNDEYADSPPDSPPATPFDDLADDSWVAAKITAARRYCEGFLGFPLTDAVYVEGFGSFNTAPTSFRCVTLGDGYVELPCGVGEVVRVQYMDAEHVLQTVSASAYSFDDFNRRLYVDETPTLSSRGSPVRVQFRGIYGGTDSPPLPVPENIKQAMLLLIGHWNENREAALTDATSIEIQFGVKSLLRPERVSLGMA